MPSFDPSTPVHPVMGPSTTSVTVKAATHSNGQKLNVSFSRQGMTLTVAFSQPLPGPVLASVRAIMENASAYTKARRQEVGNASGGHHSGHVPVQRDAVVTSPTSPTSPASPVTPTPTGPGSSVSIGDIGPTLNNAIANVIGLALAAWQRYGPNPQPAVQYITFSDDETDAVTGYNSPDEPGLVDENWVLGVFTGATEVALAEIFAEDVTKEVVKAVGEVALDFVYDGLKDLAEELSKGPDIAPQTLDMSTEIPDETMGLVPDMGATSGGATGDGNEGGDEEEGGDGEEGGGEEEGDGEEGGGEGGGTGGAHKSGQPVLL